MDDSNLQNVYNSIAYHFDKTRYKKWNSINKFLNEIPKNQYIFEVGCGNGKNMINADHIFLGFDFSIEFCKICKNKNLEVGACNNLNIPLKDNSFDHVISIAVIHHLLQGLISKYIDPIPTKYLLKSLWVIPKLYNIDLDAPFVKFVRIFEYLDIFKVSKPFRLQI
jgi:SAM-dependent methyltransferase